MSFILIPCRPLLRTPKIYPKTISCHSTQVRTKEEVRKENEENALRTYEKISHIYQKQVVKKPKRPPFTKNMFVGVFDTDLLAYPEALDKGELALLDKSLESVKTFLSQTDNLYSLDNVQRARDLKLFGLQAPQLSGGREYNVTESCRVNEILSENSSDITWTNNEQFGIQALLKLGSEKLLNRYLDDLVAGKTTIAFCILEEGNLDLNMKTTAVHSVEKNKWVLNGEKAYVINGQSAELLIVVAISNYLNKLGIKESKPTAFLVERSFGGVTSVECKKLGFDKTSMSDVKFYNTEVPAENLLGEIGEGEAVLKKILPEVRLSSGISCSTITQTTLNKFIHHCKQKSNSKTNLIQSDIVSSKIAEISANLYAMESMNYFTAALMDQYEDQDCEMETALVKTFSAEQCHKATLSCMHFLGSSAFIYDDWCNELHRNALGYLTLGESVDTLKVIIALQGLQHAGTELNGEIKKLRNPMFHAPAMLKRMFTQKRQNEDNPKLTLELRNYLHPSATIGADWLEYCVLRLQFGTETLLARYGIEVVNKHMDLHRLSECILDIYAMTTCLARASRSYCIGLQYSDYEMLLANVFCLNAMERVKARINKIYIGPYNTNDGNYNKIGEKTVKVGHYFPVHPLTKNF